MKSILLSLILLISFQLSAQDLLVTIKTVLEGETTPVDSIRINNLSNGTSLLLSDFEEEDEYVVDLAKGDFWKEEEEGSSVSEFPDRFFSIGQNSPGVLRLINNSSLHQQTVVRVYNLWGQKLLAETVDWGQQQELTIQVHEQGMLMVHVENSLINTTLKMTGSLNGVGNAMYLSETNTSVLKSSQLLDGDFSFEPGDSLQIMVYKAGYWADPILVIAMGDEIFEFEFEKPGYSFIDSRDNKEYWCVDIGNQVWMAENLAWLPDVYESSARSFTNPRYWVYGYEGRFIKEAVQVESYSLYGTLYNWEAAKTACPADWHLPTDADWKVMEQEIGLSSTLLDEMGWRGNVGVLLKGTDGWGAGNNGVDLYGFAALPAGYHNGTTGFVDQGTSSYWWCADVKVNDIIWSRQLASDNAGIDRSFDNGKMGFSIRCVKEKSQSGEISVKTLEATEITISDAVLNGEVVDDGGFGITGRGFYISDTNSDPTAGDQVEYVDGTLGLFSITLTGLDPNSTYYYKAFAESDSEVATGAAIAFTTPGELTVPVLTVESASAVTETGATLAGTVTDDGGSAISYQGFFYSATRQQPDFENGLMEIVDNLEPNFSYTLTGLAPNTTYYYRSFAVNDMGTGMSEVKSFKTDNEETVVPPTLTVQAATDVTREGAKLTGTVTNNGGAAISYQGFFYSTTNAQPDFDNGLMEIVEGTNSTFTYTITGMPPNTTIYFRSFAVNDAGTGMSEVLSFTTEENGDFGTFVDSRDHHEYKTVKIGEQTWMAENLAYLPEVSGGMDGSLTSPYYYVFNYGGTNVDDAKNSIYYQYYGVLYNHPAAVNACPSGWHLPGDDEWKELELYIGISSEEINELYTIRGIDVSAGHKLKSTDPDAWANNPGTDDYGFAAYGGGSRGEYGFNQNYQYGSWWTATYDFNNTWAFTRAMSSEWPGIWYNSMKTDMGHSVRCVKD